MVLTWSTGKPPIREHPISPGTMRAYLRDSSGGRLHRRGIGGGGGCWLLLTRKLREEFLGEGELQVRVEEVAEPMRFGE